MVPVLFKLKLAATLASGWAAGTGAPLPTGAMVAVAEAAGAPTEVHLYDENQRVTAEVAIERDGSVDEDTGKELAHLFRDWRIGREPPKGLAKKTYAMMADLARKYPDKQIEFVSAYRAGRSEGWESPHRKATALDFRIRGVPLGEIRDYLWKTYTNVGVGWYPSEGFLHMDTRPEVGDTAWTFIKGTNYYHPYWAEVARHPPAAKPDPNRHKPGV